MFRIVHALSSPHQCLHQIPTVACVKLGDWDYFGRNVLHPHKYNICMIWKGHVESNLFLWLSSWYWLLHLFGNAPDSHEGLRSDFIGAVVERATADSFFLFRAWRTNRLNTGALFHEHPGVREHTSSLMI